MRFFYFCGTPSLLVVAVTIKFVLVLGYMVESIWASESSQTSVVQVTTGDSSSSSSKGNTTSGTRKLEKCDNGNLSQCWNQIPPFPDQGIPSSPQGVEAACRAFEKGMTCVQNWTKQCLRPDARQKIMESVRGAHETFAFLCRDLKFREEFLRHASCYKRISVHWDECANRFVAAVRSLRPIHYDNPVNLCCIRRNFMRCVSEVSHHYCSKDATIFLLKMAETLVRTAMRGNTPQPKKCDSPAVIQECDRRNGGNHFGKEHHSHVFIVPIPTIFVMLSYLATCIIGTMTAHQLFFH